MGHKRIICAVLTCMLLFGCSFIPAMATEGSNNSNVMPRVSGRLNYTFAADATTQVGQPFSAARGDIIKYNCTYTPKSASVDFGFIAPDGLFYSIKCTSGNINKTIELDVTGQYTLAIRNNENYAVTVTGTVTY